MNWFTLLVAAAVAILLVEKLHISNWWMLVITPMVIVAGWVFLFVLELTIWLLLPILAVLAIYVLFMWRPA